MAKYKFEESELLDPQKVNTDINQQPLNIHILT
jgi:hypothetical protein